MKMRRFDTTLLRVPNSKDASTSNALPDILKVCSVHSAVYSDQFQILCILF